MDFCVNEATQGAGEAPAIGTISICCTLSGSRKVLFYGEGRIVYVFDFVYAALLHYINHIGK